MDESQTLEILKRLNRIVLILKVTKKIFRKGIYFIVLCDVSLFSFLRVQQTFYTRFHISFLKNAHKTLQSQSENHVVVNLFNDFYLCLKKFT